MAIDFELSGQGPSVAETMTLADMQDAAVECGFTKPNVASTKTHAQRANLNGFFKVLGVTSVSGFKKRFLNEKLPCPYPSMTPLIAEKDKVVEEKITWSVPDVGEYDALVSTWEDKKWRMLPKPGGAVIKPDDWYALHGLQKQVEEGNCREEKPMWASHGGLDFDGRERWEKWNAAKGLAKDTAKLKFVQAYGKAMAEERNALNFRKY